MNDLASRLRSLANELPERQFLERTPGLYLLIEAPLVDENEIAFNTRSVSQTRLLKAGEAAQRRMIVALEKSGRSPYTTQISVGRARNCDVVLREPSVSKLHAHFLERDEGWQVIDRGSSNGTAVNGKKLLPDVAVPVKAGDRIVFGVVQCMMADGEILFRELSAGFV